MRDYRVTLDAWKSRVAGPTYRVCLIFRAFDAEHARTQLGNRSIYFSPSTGQANVTGGVGADGIVLDEWSTVSIRPSRAAQPVPSSQWAFKPPSTTQEKG